MSDFSPGGSRIYDHSDSEPNISEDVAEVMPDWRSTVEAHLEKHFGKCSGVFHEIMSFNVHIDLYLYEATAEKPYATVVTVGASDQPLQTPEGAEIFQYIELYMHLPADWPMPDGGDMDEKYYWPFRVLKQMARFPHQLNTFLGYGHTVPNDNPPVPYAEDCPFECALLSEPLFEPKSFKKMEFEERTLTFLQLVPITKAETDIKLGLGTEALVDALVNQVKLTPELNLNRECASKYVEAPEESSATDRITFYQTAINSTRDTFAKSRGCMGFFEKRKFKPKPPMWIKVLGGGLRDIYRDCELLRTEGQIVWGHIIQANELLFDPSAKQNCPAAALYSLDPYYDGNLEELEFIAGSLFDLKGVETSANLQKFSDILADERTTQMKLKIPHELTGGRDVFYTSIMVHRNQLPVPFLAASAFPLLVHKNRTHSTMILPSKYWSNDMVGYWMTLLQLSMEGD
ncbi:MAG: suppressor of fused domain protein [Lentisphaeraceae bacterium]|nr:suppressor of fused domain protein [Lentisphaeraceae bacterium]